MTTSVAVTSSQTEALTEAARAAIVQLCIDAHQEEDFRHLFTYIPAGGRHFLAYAGELLVSHAVVTTRWLQPDGAAMLKTAYVDAVATLPGFAGQGYGRAMMSHLAKGIVDYDLACLETEIESFYAQLGWETWRGPLRCQKEGEIFLTPNQTGIMILRLPQTPALDLDRPLTVLFDGRFW